MNIKKLSQTIFFTIILFFSVSTIASAQTKNENLEIIDAYTISSNPDIATSDDFFAVGYDNNEFVRRLMIRLDISSLPENISIENAILNIEITNCEGENTGSISIARLVSQWSTDTLSWANRPGFSSPNATTDLDCLNRLAKFDITEFISGIYEEDYENNGLIIYGPDTPGTSFYFRSFNLESSNTFLSINYEVDQNEDKIEEDESTDLLNNESFLQSIFAGAILIIIIILVVASILLFDKSRKKKEKVDDDKTGNKKKSESGDNKEDVDKDANGDDKNNTEDTKEPPNPIKPKRITMNKKNKNDKKE